MKLLLDRILSQPAFADLLDELAGGQRPLRLGLIRSARLPMVAALAEATARPILLLTQRRDRALAYFEELGMWSPQAEHLFFPEPSALFYENAPWSQTARRERLGALARLAQPKDGKLPVIFASARAIMARTLPKADFQRASQTLSRGTRSQPLALAGQLVNLGYASASSVTAPGQFARRGGILDRGPRQAELPSRLEFFGDEVDSLRRFDPASQRTVIEVDTLTLTPAREYLLDNAEALGLEAKELSEFHAPLLHADLVGVFDYLPADALICIDDREALNEQIGELETQAVALRAEGLQNSTLSENYPRPYLPLDDIH